MAKNWRFSEYWLAVYFLNIIMVWTKINSLSCQILMVLERVWVFISFIWNFLALNICDIIYYYSFIHCQIFIEVNNCWKRDFWCNIILCTIFVTTLIDKRTQSSKPTGESGSRAGSSAPKTKISVEGRVRLHWTTLQFLFSEPIDNFGTIYLEVDLT